MLGFALDIVEPADSYTDSWPQLVWGVGIWVCAVAAFVTGLSENESFWADIAAIRSFDLFPMTSHVECVALLEKTGSDSRDCS